jgi:hypothetical protein
MRTNRFAALLGMALVAAVVGAVGYQIGISHGLALGGQAAAAASNAVPPYGWPPPYGWYRPWGFGFGFLFPLFFFGFWFVMLRMLFWGGPWRRGWHHAGPSDVPSRFDEWHRRAHDRMKTEPPPPTSV